MGSDEGGLGRRGFLGVLAVTAAAAGCSGGTPRRTRDELTPGTASASATATAPATRPLYLGTYTSPEGGGRGVGLARYDTSTGAITATGVVTGVVDPSFLAMAPSGRTLYAVDERDSGAVTAIALPAGGPPRVLGSRPTGGARPCHLSVHPRGRYLLSANYGSGSVAVHPIRPDGGLGARTDLVRHSTPPPGPGQDGPHAHQVLTSPDGGHVLAVDLGTDTVYTYRLDESAGTLRRVSYATLPAGSGPRSLAFHPSGRFAYLANEVGDTAVVCAYDPSTGRLTPGRPQSTGGGSGTNYPAQFLVAADGAFAYLANRGRNTLTRYAVESGGARLRLLDSVPVGGDFPRHIALAPSGRLLFAANQRSGTVTVFAVDPRTGRLTATGHPFAQPMAVCALPM